MSGSVSSVISTKAVRETLLSIITFLLSGYFTTASGRIFLPENSEKIALLFSSRSSCSIKYSWFFRSPDFSRILSRIISPQFPWVLLSPFNALVSCRASSEICWLRSFSSRTFSPREKRSLASLSYVSFTVFFSSLIFSWKGSKIVLS